MNNHLYRLVFSKRLGMLVAVSEITVRQGKAATGEGDAKNSAPMRMLVSAIALALAGLGSAYANPIGGVVTTGSGKISQNGSSMTINQASQNLGINWQSFNINANESVIFTQPNAASIALNRVIGTDGSKILGQLSANGQVFLINPNGVLFGKGAQVNTGGLVASTLGLSDQDFLAGKRTFSGNSPASVVNQGTLTAREGGYVALLGSRVSNDGVISAKLGTVGLAAGSQVTLDLAGDNLLNLKVDQAAVQALAENHGLIQADGGKVVMTASASDALLNTVVNNDGVIQAQTVSNQGGVIQLLGGEAGTTVVGGKLDASAPAGGDGGTIETSGAHVKVADNAQLTTAAAAGKTGQWLVDPVDFTVAAAGGDISGVALSNQLNANNVTLQSNNGTVNPNGSGNINVNDAVTWGANTTLTLQAVNDVNVNRNITATGDTAGLVISPGSGHYNLNQGAQITLSGAAPNLNIAGKSYTVIKDVNALQNMSSNLAGNYALGQDVDASATSSWNSGAGFTPVGNGGFTGHFDGLGHAIQNLSVNQPTNTNTGLFYYATSSADIRNVGMVGGTVTGNTAVGALVSNNAGTISNSYATGAVNGNTYSYTYYQTVCRGFQCFTSPVTTIYASNYTGGLVGYNSGTINNSYSTATVTTQPNGGTPSLYTGGLVGYNAGTINNSYAAGPVSGQNYVGGLMGFSTPTGKINTSYAASSLSGISYVDGLGTGGTINNSYAGGMENASSYNGFDFTNTWRIYEGHTTPLLQSFLKPLTVIANSDAKTYDGANYQGGNGLNCGAVSCSDSHLFNTAGYTGTAEGARNAGTYTLISDAYSDQQGYNITTVAGALTIKPKALTVAGQTALDKTYDGKTAATLSGGALSGIVGNDNVSLVSGTGAFADKNAGNNKAVTVTGSALSGADAGNYRVVDPTGLTATINKASLTVSATASNKVYDGTTVAIVSLQDNRVAGDSLSINSTGANFADKNAGAGKQVTVGGINISGTDAGNYSLANNTASTTADISKASLTLAAVADSKVYDGTTASSGTVITSGLVGGDTVNGLSQAFDSRNAGNRTLSVNNGYVINDGNHGNNYAVTARTANGTIGKASLTLSAVSDSKVYDGTTASSGVVKSAGLVNGDTINGLTQSFDSRNAGSRSLSVNSGFTVNDGNNGNNYAVATSSAGGTITPKALTVTGQTALNKTYDATTNATLAGGALVGVVGGDNVSLVSGTGAFSDKNVGANKTVTVTGTGLTGTDAGNYTVSNSTGLVANITPTALTLAASTDRKVYDGTAASTGMVSVSGLIGGDSVSGLGQAFDSKNAGDRTLSVNGGYTVNDGNSGHNYTVITSSTNGVITPRPLTITATGQNKTYDGTNRATVSLADNRVAGDNLTDAYTSANFADKNAGAGKTVTVNGLAIAGADAGNYTLANPSAITTADIARATLGLAAVADSKVYDGTTASSGAIITSGLADSDTITGLSQAFDSKNAGARTLSVNNGYVINDGNNGNNYTVNTQTASGTISKAGLTLSAVSDSKVYDGTTASAGAVQSAGLVGGDSISGLGQSFDSKNVGPRTLSVNGGYAINDGNNGNNYAVTTTAAAGSITPKGLTVTGQTAVNKVYDATTHADLAGGSLSGVVANDNVSLVSGGGAFSDKNAGANKAVTVTGTGLSGTDAGNYTVTDPAGLTASISKATLTVSATANNKVYDGTTAATASLQDNHFNGDSLSVTAAGANFADKNAGTGKQVTVNGLAISGADAGNYTLASTSAAATADINKAQVVLSAASDSKTYDGSTSSTGVVAVNGLVGGDSISNLGQSFDSKNAGNRILSVNGNYVINDGNNGNNYTVAANTAAGTIARASLNLSAATDSKVYDGTVNSGGTVTISGLVGSDSISGLAQSFDRKNAGNRTLSVNSGYALNDGNGGSNYTVSTATAQGTISPKALTVTGQAALDKTYDGTTAANLQGGALSGVIGSDNVNLVSGTGAFADKNAGSNKAVTVTGSALSGIDAGNYTLTDPTGLTATINKASLTVSATASNKVYDGTTVATASLQDNRIAGDSLSVNTTGANFADKNAGTAKQVTVAGISISGTDAGNYTLANNTAGATADISKANLTLAAAADSKVYDGTTASSGAAMASGLVGGDSISGLSQAFDSKNTGARTLSVNNGYAINDGNNGNNYTVNTQTASGTISKAGLTLSAVSDSKVYDGTTASSGVVQSAGLAGGDSISGLGQSFDSKNVGPRTLSVNGGYAINDGNNGNNYAVTTTAAPGSITPKGLTVTGQAAVDKTYDATTHADLAGGSLSGVVGNDNVSLVSGGGAFSDKNAGANKAVTVTGTGLSGTDAGNYTVTDPAGLTASISKATLTVLATANNKVYDGTTAATASLQDNHFNGDNLSVTAAGANFADKNAGAGKQVTVNGLAISGADAGNYTLASTTAATTANISPAPLVLSAVADSKTYDGTTGSSGVVQATGLVSGDTISGASQSFDSKNAGPRTLAVNGGYAINDGNNGNNYTVTTQAASGVISPALLTLSAVTDSKVYDGTTASKGAVQYSGLVTGDSLTGLSQVYDSRNAGSRTLSVNGYTINDGNNGQNYSVINNTANGTISKALLILQAVSDSKIKDNTTISDGTVEVLGLASGDSISLLDQSFDKKTPGVRTLQVNSGYVINDGNNGQNYTVITNTASGYIYQPGCANTTCQ